MNAANRPDSDSELTITRLVNAPQSLVFNVWTKPELLMRWWGPRDFTCPSCEMDFRPGGAYRTSIRSPAGEDAWMVGRYREIVEPERITFTFAWEDADGKRGLETLVTVTFTAQGDQTRLVFHQAPFDSLAERDSHRGGWTECLERLEAYVEPLQQTAQ
ncbi:SRPBCC family protein [Phyllobacterium zundukense]|uniref:Polyketide cyclase n=1 Tax=Phyllobacterium zundukense TaxID=1867719 RepID=A0A2N9VQX5_9HYPH|nr:SRPBCC domain-containing protein [Phyllobacterium zundukense]ATU92328.1 polyketide cyclase [Phyllobacterium zundukense]PIO41893.1 polyketide cyclase [Phyllobacterium zundukense]